MAHSAQPAAAELSGSEKKKERLNKSIHKIDAGVSCLIGRQTSCLAWNSSKELGVVLSTHVSLSLEEAGAHVEYLYQRGELAAANLEEIETQPRPVIRYLKV